MHKESRKDKKDEMDFWGESILETPFTFKRWFLNWKFPFVHRIVRTYTIRNLQKELNKAINEGIVTLIK